MGICMKKRMMIILLCIGIVLQITACGAASSTASDIEKRKELAREGIEANRKKVVPEEEAPVEETLEEESEEEIPESPERDSIVRESQDDRANENSGKNREGNYFDIYSLSFALPEGWEIDDEMTDEYETVFAPGGNSEKSGECVAIMSPEEAFGMVDYFLEDMEYMKGVWEEEFEDEADFVEAEDIGLTFLGRTVRMTIVEHVDGEADAGVFYIAEDDVNMYMIYAYTVIDDGEEAAISDSLTEAVEMLFETGRVTDSAL